MKKGNMCLQMFCIFLLAGCFISCGKQSKNEAIDGAAKESNLAQNETKLVSINDDDPALDTYTGYEYEDFQLTIDEKEYLGKMACGKDQCYFYTINCDIHKVSGLYRVDMKDQSVDSLDYSCILGYVIFSMDVDSSGNLVFLLKKTDEGGASLGLEMKVISPNGEIIEEIDLADYFGNVSVQRYYAAMDRSDGFFIWSIDSFKQFQKNKELTKDYIFDDSKAIGMMCYVGDILYCTYSENEKEYLGTIKDDHIEEVSLLPYQGRNTDKLISDLNGNLIFLNKLAGVYLWDCEEQDFVMIKESAQIKEELNCTDLDLEEIVIGCFENNCVAIYYNHLLSFRMEKKQNE